MPCLDCDTADTQLNTTQNSVVSRRAVVVVPDAFTFGGTCRNETPVLPVTPGRDRLLIPPLPRLADRQEVYGDLIRPAAMEGGRDELPLTYPPVEDGGRFCAASDEEVQYTLGGTVIFIGEEDTCLLPPSAADGSPCCRLRLWHPNAEGYYFNECTVSCAFSAALSDPDQRVASHVVHQGCTRLGTNIAKDRAGSLTRYEQCRKMLTPDGLYYWRTIWPGNERIVGWGPDSEPHVHWDVLCESCVDAPFTDGAIWRYNKIYLDEPCTMSGCAQPQSGHLATRLSSTVVRYDIVVNEATPRQFF